MLALLLSSFSCQSRKSYHAPNMAAGFGYSPKLQEVWSGLAQDILLRWGKEKMSSPCLPPPHSMYKPTELVVKYLFNTDNRIQCCSQLLSAPPIIGSPQHIESLEFRDLQLFSLSFSMALCNVLCTLVAQYESNLLQGYLSKTSLNVAQWFSFYAPKNPGVSWRKDRQC